MKKLFVTLIFIFPLLTIYAEDYIPYFYDLVLKDASTIEISEAQAKGVVISDSSESIIYIINATENKNPYMLIHIVKSNNNYVFELSQQFQFGFSLVSDYPNLVLTLNYINMQNDIDYSIISSNENTLRIRSMHELPLTGSNWGDIDVLLYPPLATNYYSINNTKYKLYRNRETWGSYGKTIVSYYYKINETHFQLYLEEPDNMNYPTHINDNNVRLRSKPSLNSSILDLLSNGSKIRILFIAPFIETINSTKGYWVLVQTERLKIGWVFSQYIQKLSFGEK